jgi:hypothetical protein
MLPNWKRIWLLVSSICSGSSLSASKRFNSRTVLRGRISSWRGKSVSPSNGMLA